MSVKMNGNMTNITDNCKIDLHGNVIAGPDMVLDFALQIAHGGFHHKKWLIKAALNYMEDRDLNHENEGVPACP